MTGRVYSAAALFVLFAAPTVAQDVTVTGARVTLVEKPLPGLTLTLENRAESALVAWVLADMRDRPVANRMADYATTPVSRSQDDGPVAPGARRRIETSGDSSELLLLAVFADGHYEGDDKAAELLRSRRQKRAAVLRYWIDALKDLPRDNDEARRLVQAHLEARPAEDAVHEFSLTERLKRIAARPEPWSLAAGIDPLLAEARKDVTILERPIRRTAFEPVSVAFTAVPAGGGAVGYAVVENLRDVPLDAFKLTYVDPTSRGPSHKLVDAGGALDQPTGEGPIAPGEKRELFLTWRRPGDAPTRALVISLLIFDDLRWQGHAAEHEAALRRRERWAEDNAFWIAALDRAARLSVTGAIEYLELTERRRASSEHYDVDRRTIDELVERARIAPATFRSAMAELAYRLERQRLALLRHR